MPKENIEILLKLHEELVSNTDATKEIRRDIISLKEQVKFTNGKVRLHTKILLVVGAITATLLITSGDEKIIKIVNLFL